MKDQYFGDINDYRNFGLLRAILRASQLRLLIAWMLTPNDGSTDGKHIAYLNKPDHWSHHDPVLFHTIQNLLASGPQRQASSIESTDLFPNTGYFSTQVPDNPAARSAWFASLCQQAEGYDLVFLDPDNGLEVKSKPYGVRNSSKYLYWHEVTALWESGKSLLIFQHYNREKRPPFIQRMLTALSKATPGSLVEAFSTKFVVFLLALQPEHHSLHVPIVNTVQENWAGQIYHWELAQAHYGVSSGSLNELAEVNRSNEHSSMMVCIPAPIGLVNTTPYIEWSFSYTGLAERLTSGSILLGV